MNKSLFYIVVVAALGGFLSALAAMGLRWGLRWGQTLWTENVDK